MEKNIDFMNALTKLEEDNSMSSLTEYIFIFIYSVMQIRVSWNKIIPYLT